MLRVKPHQINLQIVAVSTPQINKMTLYGWPSIHQNMAANIPQSTSTYQTCRSSDVIQCYLSTSLGSCSRPTPSLFCRRDNSAANRNTVRITSVNTAINVQYSPSASQYNITALNIITVITITIIIRAHRATMCIDAANCYRLSSVVCQSIITTTTTTSV